MSSLLYEYEYFSNNEEFLFWQKENKNCVINNIFPVLDSITITKLDNQENHKCVGTIFVLYQKEENE